MPNPELARAPRRFTGLPSEVRRRQRRELLVEAASGLLGAARPEGLTVRAVLERARLHPRYLYESFADLDELAVAAYDRALEQLSAAVCDALAAAGPDPADQVGAVVRSTVTFVARDPIRGRLLYAPLGIPALERRRAETTSAVVAAATHYGAARQGGGPDPVGWAATSMLVGGVGQLLADWLAGRVPLRPDQLAEEAADLVLAVADRAAARTARRPGGAGEPLGRPAV